MASKAKQQPKEEAPEKEAEGAPDQPLPLLDLSDAGVKKMIKAAKKRGYVTYEQLNAVMPSEEVTSEQIEDTLAMLSEMGINVVETEDANDDEGEEKATDEVASADDDDDDEPGREVVEAKTKSLAVAEKKEPSERTDDPVRMYLREMGSVELLSREGEIAIAKRIEAGREAMIAGLCESPLTFQAIIIWRDELAEGKVFLRDIIDLEATYAGPDAQKMQVPVVIGPDGKPIAQVPGATPVPGAPHLQVVQPAATPPAAPAAATPFKAPGRRVPQARPATRNRRIRPRPRPKAITTRTSWKARSRSRPSRPSSSPRWSRPSTTSPTASRSCAVCRNRTLKTACAVPRCRRCRRRRSANTASSRTRSSPR